MPGTFQIFPAHGLVYVRYTGHVLHEDTAQLMARYNQHPDARPGYKQLVDLSRVTSFEQDFPRLMRIQAEKLDIILRGVPQTLMIYYAPNDMAQQMARFIVRSWSGLSGLVISVQSTEEQALSILGLPEPSIEALLSGVA